MTLAQIIDQVRDLSPDQRIQLIHQIEALNAAPAQPPRTRSLLELAGLGAEIWKGIDAQEYVNALRDEWDHRES